MGLASSRDSPATGRTSSTSRGISHSVGEVRNALYSKDRTRWWLELRDEEGSAMPSCDMWKPLDSEEPRVDGLRDVARWRFWTRNHELADCGTKALRSEIEEWTRKWVPKFKKKQKETRKRPKKTSRIDLRELAECVAFLSKKEKFKPLNLKNDEEHQRTPNKIKEKSWFRSENRLGEI